MAAPHVAIIGAGMGGLSAAIRLAQNGFQVTLCEKEASPGGKARRLAVDGVAVDGGPTVCTQREIFEGLFAASGERLADHLTISQSEIIARHGWADGSQLDLFADFERSVDAVGDFAGAREAKGFRAFSKEAKRLYEALDGPFMQSPKSDPLRLTFRVMRHRPASAFSVRAFESIWHALGKYFRDARLQQLFGRYATYCGSDPFRAPATLMLIAHVEARGVWLIDGGISALAAAMAGLAERAGATIRYSSPVARILKDGKRASGVELADGTRIAADCVLANADPSALATGWFGEDAAAAVPALDPAKRSLSAFVWTGHAKLTGFPLSYHNVFFSRDYRAEFDAIRAGKLAQEPTVYLCAQDRFDNLARTGRERFQIIVNAPANGDSHVYNDNEIARCTAAMEATARRCGLEFESDWPRVLTTPTQFDELFPATGGALYGRASHGWAASFLRQGATTRLPGLYCAGGGAHPGAGIPMAAQSGEIAAAAIIRKERRG